MDSTGYIQYTWSEKSILTYVFDISTALIYTMLTNTLKAIAYRYLIVFKKGYINGFFET